MNSWGNEHYGMMGGMMPPNIMGPNMGPPPFAMMGDMGPPVNQMGPGRPIGLIGHNSQPVAIVGPVAPDNIRNKGQEPIDLDDEQGNEEMQIVVPDKSQMLQRERNNNDRRDRDRDRGMGRGKGRRRSRSRNRDRGVDREMDHGLDQSMDRGMDRSMDRGMDRSMDRGMDRSKDRGMMRGMGRGKPNNNRDNRNRGDDKWEHDDRNPIQPLKPPSVMMQRHPNMMQPFNNMMPNNMIPPNMIPHNPMMHQMDMSNMQQMMPHPAMGGMMMMMHPHMHISSVPIYCSAGVILPALPGTSTPPRRDRPQGCRTIFVGGLPPGISQDVIMEIFERFGDIQEVKLHKGVCHVRFEQQNSLEMAFMMSGCRLKTHDQSDNEATTLYIDYAMNREDQVEYEKSKRKREPTPPRVESYTPQAFTAVSDKIKSDTDFSEAAPTLVAWLERGECTKKNSNNFYSLIQASNNQLRRLFNEKMLIDEEFQTLKNTMREKFAHILLQFEQVAKILTAAKHQRASDHFSKQQRRNIEMWLKMTEELDNIKEEFSATFDDEEVERSGRNVVSLEKYEQLRIDNENLTFELEGYKNEAHLAKDEAERKFEKFKAHFIAQQALLNKQSVYPPLPAPPMPSLLHFKQDSKLKSATSVSDAKTPKPSSPVPPSEAKLISIISAFLMVHPLGASLDYIVSYVKSMVPGSTQACIHDILTKYSDVFQRKTTGIGANIEHKWGFVIFDSVKA